jgi:hypothetical protein
MPEGVVQAKPGQGSERCLARVLPLAADKLHERPQSVPWAVEVVG